MSAHRPLFHQFSDRTERVWLIVGSVVCWILIALLFRFASTRASVCPAVLIGPCVLLLTYFAFGGDIPLRFRQEGYRKFDVVPVVFWISFVIAVIVLRFAHLSLD